MVRDGFAVMPAGDVEWFFRRHAELVEQGVRWGEVVAHHPAVKRGDTILGFPAFPGPRALGYREPNLWVRAMTPPPRMRVTPAGGWWLAICTACGHVGSDRAHRKALGLAHVHLLEGCS